MAATQIVIRDLFKTECFTMIFQHIKAFTEHINIMFEAERLYIQSMDSSRVSIFEITLPNTWFNEYTLFENKPFTIGVNSSLLYRILNTREKSQEMKFIYDTTGNSDKLFINFTSDNKAIFDKEFELPLMELDCDIMAIPNFESNAELSISSQNFSNIVNQMKLFGDTLDVECSEENIVLNSVSQENGKMRVIINIDDLTTYSINEGERVKLSFSLNILHNICLYNKMSKEIEIHFTENYPMKVIYQLGEEGAKMLFYLAPKISDDDDI
jgi:proliferating cell nuclear antigen PCNA